MLKFWFFSYISLRLSSGTCLLPCVVFLAINMCSWVCCLGFIMGLSWFLQHMPLLVIPQIQMMSFWNTTNFRFQLGLNPGWFLIICRLVFLWVFSSVEDQTVAGRIAAVSLRYQQGLYLRNAGENLLYPTEKLIRNQSIGNWNGPVETST